MIVRKYSNNLSQLSVLKVVCERECVLIVDNFDVIDAMIIAPCG